MNSDFASAMRRSLALTRAGNPGEATRLILKTLRASGSDQTPVAPEPAAGAQVPPRQRATARVPESAIPDAEIVDTPPPRRRLREVVAGLARKRPPVAPRQKRAQVAPPVPDGARFEHRQYRSAHGGRDYRLYVPAGPAKNIRGVVIMLHGCTQTPEDFAVGTGMNAQADQHGLVVVYPEQTRAENPAQCWNWFRTSDQSAGAGEPAILSGLAETVAQEFGVPPGQVFAAGLSAGGAMAAILGHARPDLFGAVGVHSGLAPGSATDMVSAFAAMRGDPTAAAGPLKVPAIVFHGLADTTVAPVNGRRGAGLPGNAATQSRQVSGRNVHVTAGRNAAGHPVELWEIEGIGHAWSGGAPEGSYTDPSGPDASAEMVRFFRSRMEPRA
ncbi:MAG: PHB depolymerase family esterase [Mangrovicoccus sp.]|nr:PHB depolymerase family esterase [Mangrovicoccus sp.]